MAYWLILALIAALGITGAWVRFNRLKAIRARLEREYMNVLEQRDKLSDYVFALDAYVQDLRALLPGEKKPIELHDVLETFGEKAVKDIGMLMAACIDYRNLLIRANVPDSVSPRHDGVESIANHYGIKLERRKNPHGGESFWMGVMTSD